MKTIEYWNSVVSRTNKSPVIMFDKGYWRVFYRDITGKVRSEKRVTFAYITIKARKIWNTHYLTKE